MKDLKNILKLFGIAAWALAAIGGTGYCLYAHKYLIAASIVFLAVIAFPTIKNWWPRAEAKAPENAAKPAPKKATSKK